MRHNTCFARRVYPYHSSRARRGRPGPAATRALTAEQGNPRQAWAHPMSPRAESVLLAKSSRPGVDCVSVCIPVAPLGIQWWHVRHGVGESLPPPPLRVALSPWLAVARPRRSRPGASHLMCACTVSPILQRTLIHDSHAHSWNGASLPSPACSRRRGVALPLGARRYQLQESPPLAASAWSRVHTGPREGQHKKREGGGL